MQIIQFLQSHSNSFLTFLFSFFLFLFSPEGIIILFTIVFLFSSKSNSFKLIFALLIAYIIGDILLKNIFIVDRPYVANDELFTNLFSSLSSFPSTSVMLCSSFSTFLLVNFGFDKNYNLNKSNKKDKICLLSLLIVSLLILNVLLITSKLYFAQNYILDLLVGFTLGVLIYIVVHKIPRFDSSPFMLLLLILPLVAVLINLVSKAIDLRVLKFAGAFTAIILGLFLEQKIVKYKSSNNLITLCIKIIVLIAIFLPNHFLLHVLPSISLVQFAIYFLLGIIATLLLPLIFTSVDNYAYVFSKDVDRDRVKFSAISLSTRGTSRIARKLSRYISKGDTVLLVGDLGAGKSELVRSFLLHNSVKNKITSPTFTLVNVHSSLDTTYYHFDMYRLEDEEEVQNIGFEEMLGDDNAIKFIEWPDKVNSYLPKKFKKITIVKLSRTCRNIIFEDYN